MATQKHPVAREVTSGDGSAQEFSSRIADNGVPGDVIRRVVVTLNIHDTSGADNSVVIEERDPDAASTLRDWTFEVAANGSLTFSEDELGIYARQDNIIRAQGDGAFDAEIEFVDER